MDVLYNKSTRLIKETGGENTVCMSELLVEVEANRN